MYLGAFFFIISLIATAWLLVGVVARNSYLNLTIQNRDLQIGIAASAMEENFRLNIDESHILATFSFPEFLEGKRTAASMRDLLASQRASIPDIVGNAYYDAPGHRRFSSSAEGAEQMMRILDTMSRTSWQDLATTGARVFPGRGPRPYFIYFHPVIEGSQLRGLYGVVVDFEKEIIRYLAPLETKAGRRAFLLDEDERVLWSSKVDEIGKTIPTTLETGEKFESDRSFRLYDRTFRIRIFDNHDTVRAALAPVDDLRTLVFGVGMILLTVTMVVLSRLYLSENRRKRLAEEEARLEHAVTERERELSESELRYTALFEGASEAILILDREGKIARCNKRAESLFGLPAGALLGRDCAALSPTSQSAEEPSSSASAAALVAACLKEGSQAREWKFLSSDAREFVAEMGLAAVDSGGGTYILAILRDVTARRRDERRLREALDDREILLRELHHRVKNNLQFIQSLIELQKGTAAKEIRRALEEVESRVSVLSAAYFAVAEDPDSRKVAAAYLQTVCDQVQLEAEFRGKVSPVDFACEDLPITIDSAVPLGLVLRELLDNALCHGYGTSRRGPVRVRFVHEDSVALLEVRDWGSGSPGSFVDGLGLSIARALAQQLGGELCLEEAFPGTLAQAKIPLT